MKHINAIIIEENNTDALFIKRIIEQQYSECITVDILQTQKETEIIVRNKLFDILILDLQTGMNQTFEILQKNPNSLDKKALILITSEEEKKLEAIADISVDFISKPLDPRAILAAIKKAKDQIVIPNQQEESVNTEREPLKPLNLLAIPSANDIKLLKIDDILYLQSEGRYTSFHTTKNNTVVSSTNIGEYEKKLIHNNFFRIHNSFLVNMDNIVNVQKKDGVYIEMNNRAMIPVAKRKKESLFQFLGIK